MGMPMLFFLLVLLKSKIRKWLKTNHWFHSDVPVEVFAGSELSCVSTISVHLNKIYPFNMSGSLGYQTGGWKRISLPFGTTHWWYYLFVKISPSPAVWSIGHSYSEQHSPVINEIGITPSDEVKIGTELICSGAASDADLQELDFF